MEETEEEVKEEIKEEPKKTISLEVKIPEALPEGSVLVESEDGTHRYDWGASLASKRKISGYTVMAETKAIQFHTVDASGNAISFEILASEKDSFVDDTENTELTIYEKRELSYYSDKIFYAYKW
ncbi:hypothetical protein [Proteiniclasticum ruminis]|uniref:hypothetical protein n=1 Tax=Proteiniclasticum ruminis TaxID=398199 RepID=UPI0015A6F197|nr:hypothetical protein [Proteiniclasticum ruminis]